jgi:hypothetical protein
MTFHLETGQGIVRMAKRLTVILGFSGFLLSQTEAWADATQDIKAVFERFIVAMNVRDTDALKELLSDTPNFLWVAGGTPVQGRDAALQDLDELCQGALYLDPAMAAFRTIELSGDVVQLYAPVIFVPSPSAPPQQMQPTRPEKPPLMPRLRPVPQLPPEKFIISQTMVKTSTGWRIATIFTFPVRAIALARPL